MQYLIDSSLDPDVEEKNVTKNIISSSEKIWTIE
jgi:hypothetical protein